MYHPRIGRYTLLAVVTGLWAVHTATAGDTARFLTFDEAREIVSEFADTVAPADLPDTTSWAHWISVGDADVRNRIDHGFEDSISNLILYGSTFTARARIESAEDAVTPKGGLSEAARHRLSDFVSALAREPKNERVRFAANFLTRHGVAVSAWSSVLAANLSRFVLEQSSYQDTLAAAGKSPDPSQLLLARSTLYRNRGLSVDTSLLPNFAIEDTLRVMLAKGALSPGFIRRVAIIGPGLDFADKRSGYDYYPLQSIQPFAVLEGVVRLGLGVDPVEMTVFDLNPAVLSHIRAAARQARSGHPYLIQLPRNVQSGWTPQVLTYWQHFGEIIGTPASPITPPLSLKNDILTRAVAIRPRYTAQMDSVDLDIVAQTLDAQPGAGFDLVVATNILVYYDQFHQALAKASIAHMLNPGGVLLVNHTLPSRPAGLLEFVGRRSVSYSSTAAYGDDVVVYRRRRL